jgi:hypothetical protein
MRAVIANVIAVSKILGASRTLANDRRGLGHGAAESQSDVGQKKKAPATGA